MPAATDDPITDVQLFHELPDDAPNELRSMLANYPGKWAAYRFTTEDGRVSWCPVSEQLLKDGAVDVEAACRKMAVSSLTKLVEA